MPRRPGRPPGSRSGHRQKLLAAARELLADPDATPLTLQQAARRAGVTPALAHYYFGSRDGLLQAVIDEKAGPRIDDLLDAARVRAAEPVAALTFLMQRTISLLLADPLVRRCLWLQAGPAQALRERLRRALVDLLGKAQHAGLLRSDLPAAHLADALLGLVLFPFLDEPGEAGNAERATALTLHNLALLQDGIVRAQRPRQESSA